MAESINKRWSRRGTRLLVSGTFILLIGWVLQVYATALKNSQWLSGWILVALIVVLMLYNARKKIPFLPIGRNRSWLQLHLYVGLIATFVFMMHLQWRWPDGYIEFPLALLFVIISASGVAGILMSRLFARRLAHQGEQLIFERIPGFAVTLRDSAEALVRDSIETTESTTLADFYSRNVAEFFARPRFSFRYLFNSRRRYFKLTNELAAQERYMNDKETEFAEQLLDLVTQKNSLDIQYALQLTLKSWLFVHIPLTYAMVLVLLAHIVLVYGFGAV
jgi:hypothetical protein